MKRVSVLFLLGFIIIIGAILLSSKNKQNDPSEYNVFVNGKNKPISVSYLERETFDNILSYPSETIFSNDYFIDNVTGNSPREEVEVSNEFTSFGEEVTFSRAFHINHIEKIANRSTVLTVPDGAVSVDDIIYLEFYIKAISFDDYMGGIPFSINCPGLNGYNPLIKVEDDGNWYRYQYVDKASEDNMSKNECRFVYENNNSNTEFYIGGFEMKKIHIPYDIDGLSLPESERYYGGMEEDALWRGEALERIRLNRMFRAEITITNNGSAISGANLFINQLNHDYKFGSTFKVNGYHNRTDEEKAYYADIYYLMNNETVMANHLKWKSKDYWIGYRNYVVDLALQNNSTLRGHTIHWPKSGNTPTEIWNEVERLHEEVGFEQAKEYLYHQTMLRVDEAMNQFEGQIYDWDIVNEFPDGKDYFSHNRDDYPQYLEYSVIGEWFKRVQELDSNVIRTVNDYNYLRSNERSVNSRLDIWDIVFTEAENAGAPVQQFGFQGHLHRVPSIDYMEWLFAHMDERYGVPFKITEYDLSSRNEDTQARFLRDLLIYTFSHPNFNGFINWTWNEGIYGDGTYNINSMFKPDGTLTKKGAAWMNTIYDELWIYNDQYHNTNGVVSHDLYYGEYELFVEYNGALYRDTFYISKDTSDFSIEFDIQRAEQVGTEFNEQLLHNRLQLLLSRIDESY